LLGLAAKVSVHPAMATASFLICGGLLASEAKLPIGATTALAGLLGLLHGYMNGAPVGGPALGGKALAGVAAVVFVLAALSAGLAAPLRRPAARIAVRVAGSWIAAIGLLLLGWSLRRGA
ncbi:MAG: HupE/UreJ family protein, partial [Thermoanaerobaculia bacterium]